MNGFQLSSRFGPPQSQGLGGVRNGELLRRAAEAGFDALITSDKRMEYQQNASELKLTVVVMHAIRIRVQDLEPLVPKVVEVLRDRPARAFIRVHG